MLDQHITIIGAGTMGRTIATGLVRASVADPSQVTITDHSHKKADTLAQELGAHSNTKNDDACRNADIILLCVKPKDVRPTLRELQETQSLRPSALIISIAAGVSTATIEELTGNTIPVLRAMPNTPCLVGAGMTVISKGAHASDLHTSIAHKIFTPLGRCISLDEKHMDVVTGLSGSGPAFVYVMLEALADGGVMCGLPRKTATELVAQVALGAATMILSTDRHPSSLKDDVTTPGGCTIAGLLALEDGKIRSVLARAVEKATQTAAGLGSPSA